MRRIAIINQKGGVGKTTTTANLGAALALSGSRVLLVDLDPQAHLSLHFGVELGDGQRSVYDMLTAATPARDVVQNVRQQVALIPSDIDLAGAETELVSVTGREVLLRESLVSFESDFDYLLIDCPPSLGVLTLNALVACNEVVIPLQAHFLALQGLSRLLDTVTLVCQRINPALKVSGIVLCMYEPATRLAGEVVQDLSQFLDQARNTTHPWSRTTLYESYIRRNIKLAESSSFGQTVFDYAPRSNGATDYAKLAEEIQRIGSFGRIGPSPVATQDGDDRDPVSPDRPVVEHPERTRTTRTIDSTPPAEPTAAPCPSPDAPPPTVRSGTTSTPSLGSR